MSTTTTKITKESLSEMRKKGKMVFEFENIADFQNSLRNAYAAAKTLNPKKFEIKQIPKKGIIIISRTE